MSLVRSRKDYPRNGCGNDFLKNPMTDSPSARWVDQREKLLEILRFRPLSLEVLII